MAVGTSRVSILVLILIVSGVVSAQFGDFFQNLFKKKEMPLDSNWVEQEYDRVSCDQYVCPDTLACVASYLDCPCPFSSSQIKCVLPNNKAFVCISKPADGDLALYDDPATASNAEGDGSIRDCSFVNLAWKGLV